ncbi:MAG: MoxR family ATPase [Albidovulum sp.]|nr:MoxR family ATPase [Albidovulum sp.]
MDADSENLLREIESLGELLRDVKGMIGRRIVGQESVVDLALVALLSGGHALLVGVPGLGKSKLVETVAVVAGLTSNRIQFTPDLMPADIVGSEVLETDDSGKRRFRFIEGPVFCQLLMADEINRASPRTQSALLEAMQECRISFAGIDRDLPNPFHVLATENPIELEGTYPLPEAQLDRFLVKIDVDYPERDAERRILLETTGPEQAEITRVMTPEDLVVAQKIVRRMPVGEAVVEHLLDVVRACRPNSEEASERVASGIGWGPGPRAAQSLMLAVRAKALLDGRLAPSIDDVAKLARPVLSHRMALAFSARAQGEDLGELINEVARQARM